MIVLAPLRLHALRVGFGMGGFADHLVWQSERVGVIDARRFEDGFLAALWMRHTLPDPVWHGRSSSKMWGCYNHGVGDLNDAYATLGLPAGAPLPEVKAAYRQRVKACHPDRFSYDDEVQARAQAELVRINEAFARIRDGTAAAGTGNPTASPDEERAAGAARPQTYRTPPAQARARANARKERLRREAERTLRRARAARRRQLAQWGFVVVPLAMAGLTAWQGLELGGAWTTASWAVAGACTAAAAALGVRSWRHESMRSAALRTESLRCSHCGGHPVSRLRGAVRRLRTLLDRGRCASCGHAPWLH